MFKNQDGLTARALLYPLRWLGLGAEGSWFTEKNFYQNTYRDTLYGILAKGILTPDTMPELYILLGGGEAKQEGSYLGRLDRTQKVRYGQIGLGVSLALYRGVFLAAEGQLVYHAHKKIDTFLHQHHRMERVVSLRGGVRF